MSTTTTKEPWRWDGPRFGRWLRKWRLSEHLEWSEMSELCGVHVSTLQTLARGTKSARGGSPLDESDPETWMDPAISTVVRIAQGLDLELAYVIRQAGIDPHNDRWSNFNSVERESLATALRHYLLLEQHADLSPNPILRRLLEQLESTMPTPVEKEEVHAR